MRVTSKVNSGLRPWLWHDARRVEAAILRHGALFLFVLYMDPHWDYLPPAPFNAMFTDDPVPPPRNIWNLGAARVPEAARRRTLAAYDGEIRYTDGCFSNLLATIDASPRSRNSLVVFCADHGEAFWERRFPTILVTCRSHGVDPVTELVGRLARGDGLGARFVVEEQVDLPWTLRRDGRSALVHSIHYLRLRKTG